MTELALYRYLVGQLDLQVQDASHRSVRIFIEPPPPPTPGRHRPRSYPRPGPGPVFLDAPAQPVGMVAAVVRNGETVDAGYLTTAGARATLSDTAKAQLDAVVPNRIPVTRQLDGLGRYRVVAAHTRHGG
ncbi:MAG: two-component sensor histidine kinase, partial [Mycobacterium sp.]|nr:two-component sensor histidine kinase [Mycobacterium sp.]